MVEFVHLDIDNSEFNGARQEYRIRGRSEYIFYDANGEEVRRWFGLLNSGHIEAAIDSSLN